VQQRKQQLNSLYRNLNILRERESRYGGNAPLELLNQIEDHRQAIDLIEQALAGNLTNAKLDEALAPLTLAMHQGQVVHLHTTDVRWLPVVVALAAVVGVFAVLFWRLGPERQPERMPPGAFNVAVAEFTVLDENGTPVSSDDGRQLAAWLTRQLKTNFNELELDKITTWNVWGPVETGAISGVDREQAAQALADKIGATVLIYGTLTDRGAQSRFAPEFYVNPAAFTKADNITGEHELGDDLPLVLPFGNEVTAIRYPALAGRTRALTLITLGLAYYTIDDEDGAISFFKKAINEERWLPGDGKHIVHLLLGNAWGLRISKEQSPADLPSAKAQYERALEIKPDYGRAMLGLANIYFLQAQGNPDQIMADPMLLAEAEHLLDVASTLEGQPESANIGTKAHLLRGQMAMLDYFVRNTEQDWLNVAKTEFEQVVLDFESGDTQVGGLAAHAYARLGYIADTHGDAILAIEYLKKAVASASPYYKGEYYTWLARLYWDNDQLDLAESAFEAAIDAAISNGDAEAVQRYQALQQHVLGGD
jgi:tetratricopeptide (TPR) repeat protein